MSAYRNPRYCFGHLFRNFVAPLDFTAPEDPDFPKERLIDGANGPLWRSGNLAVDAEVEFKFEDTADLAFRPPIRRMLIPSSFQNYKQTQRVDPQYSNDGISWSDAFLLENARSQLYAPPDVWDFEFNVGTNTSQWWRAVFLAQATNAKEQEAGEIYASDIVTTESGIVQTWEDLDEPNVNVATSTSGNVYSNTRGDARRIWRMEYQNIVNGEAASLDLLRRLAGIQGQAFWFDPPDSGDAVADQGYFVADPDTGTWVLDEVDVSVQFLQDGFGNPFGAPYMKITSTSGTFDGTQTLNVDTPIDWREKFIQVDVKVPTGQTWAEDINAIRVRLGDDTAPGIGTNAIYSVSKVFVEQAPDSQWRRLYIDPINDGSLGGTVAADLTNTLSVSFETQFGTDSVECDLGTFAIVDRTKRPVFVELLDFRKQQSSQNPGARIAYDIDLAVRQVLT